MSKPLEYLVIHCTATPAGREVTSDEIRRWHTSPVGEGGRGWRQVGYTDMIHLDGRIERLVPNNEDGLVDPWEITNGVKGKNSVSRHIVYVGGLSPRWRPADTRTPEQLEAMRGYVLDFHRRHPSVKICGHNDLADKPCPCFNVGSWLKTIGL